MGYSCTVPSTMHGKLLVAEQVKLKIEMFVLGDIGIANTPIIIGIANTPIIIGSTLPMVTFTSLMFGAKKNNFSL
jgi:hypothetical protein